MSRRIRLLVAGGSGFIGRHIVRQALARGWEVTCLSLHEKNFGDGVRQVCADVCDAQALAVALGEACFDHVLWCAGYIDHADFFKGGLQVIRTRLVGALNLIALLDRSVLRSYVSIGSADEYGLQASPQLESRAADPTSPYGLANAQVSDLLRRLQHDAGFPSVILRPFLVYGPDQFAPRLVPWIIGEILAHRSVTINAPENTRDLLYVDDLVDAIFLAFDCVEARGEILNICSGASISVGALVEKVAGIVGHGGWIKPASVTPRRENKFLFGDNAKARSMLDWGPRVSLADGLERTIAWQARSLAGDRT